MADNKLLNAIAVHVREARETNASGFMDITETHLTAAERLLGHAGADMPPVPSSMADNLPEQSWGKEEVAQFTWEDEDIDEISPFTMEELRMAVVDASDEQIRDLKQWIDEVEQSKEETGDEEASAP